MPIIDLTHTFTASMPVYPGDAKPTVEQTAFLTEHGYNDFSIRTGMHVGTHIDAPLHMVENGKRIAAYPVERFVGQGVLLDAREKKIIDTDLLDGKTVEHGSIVLVLTGFDHCYHDARYFTDFPKMTEQFAKKLVAAGVIIVGMDTASPDVAPFPVHKILLGNDVLILENLTNLSTLLNVPQFEVLALPAKYDVEAAPVRVIARYP